VRTTRMQLIVASLAAMLLAGGVSYLLGKIGF
jgi:hypothetical protein